MNKITSNIISYLRFPLCAAIVMIHSDIAIYNTSAANLELYHSFSTIFIDSICSAAVALFFFISGYLFFHESAFNAQIYKKKIKNRIHSILIPYLLWNIICFVILFILQNTFSTFSLLLHKKIATFTPQDYLYIFWNIQKITELSSDQQGPLVGQFWFLQCLFTFTILAPIIYFTIKKTKLFIVLVILLLCLTDKTPSMPGFNVVSLYYFTLGAFFSISNIKCYTEKIGIYLYTMVGYIIFYIFRNVMQLEHLKLIDETLLIFTIIGITYHITKGKNISNRALYLCNSCFFVFAIHRYFTSIGLNIAKKITFHNSLEALICFLCISSISIVFSVLCYQLMHKVLPKTTRILTGNRHI